jgi:hypothetical protein
MQTKLSSSNRVCSETTFSEYYANVGGQGEKTPVVNVFFPIDLTFWFQMGLCHFWRTMVPTDSAGNKKFE